MSVFLEELVAVKVLACSFAASDEEEVVEE